MKRWGDLLKVAVGVGLLGWLLSSVELGRLRELSRHGTPASLWLGLAALAAAFPVLQTLRLHVLVGRYTGSLPASTRLFFVGALFNNVLPSNVGGDAVRLYYLRGSAGELVTPLLLLLLHRVTQLGVLLLIALGAALLRPGRVAFAVEQLALRPGAWSALGWGAALAVVALLVGLSLPAGRRAAARLGRLAGRVRASAATVTPAMVAVLLAWTLVFHLARMLGFQQLCAYFGHAVSLPEIALVLALTALAGLLPITVGGLGVMEGAIVAGLAVFAVASPAALGVALLNRTVLLANAVVGGLVYVVDRRRIGPGTAPAVDSEAPR